MRGETHKVNFSLNYNTDFSLNYNTASSNAALNGLSACALYSLCTEVYKNGNFYSVELWNM